MMNQAAIAILPGDKPACSTEGLCSRCGGEMGPRIVEAHWNGIAFVYCSLCQSKAEGRHD